MQQQDVQPKSRAIILAAATLAMVLGLGRMPVARAAEGLIPIKAGTMPVTGHAKFFVAKEKGFFADQGLDVELVEFVNSADGLAALRAGKLDFAAFGTTAPLVHIAKDADIRIVAGIMGEDASLVATPEKAAEIKSVADLKGRKLATVRLATGDAVVRGALARAGLDWRKDLQLFELKSPPAVIEAVKSGEVDAGVIWDPHDQRAEEMGLKIIVRSHDLQPGHPCCRLVVTSDYATKNPEIIEKFITALLVAEKFGHGHKKETVEIIANRLKLDPALVERAYNSGFLEQHTDPNLIGVVTFWNVMRDSNFVESDKDITKYVDTGTYKRALDKLSAANPGDPYWQALERLYEERDTPQALKKALAAGATGAGGHGASGHDAPK